MNIEVGKYYKDENGVKVYIGYKHEGIIYGHYVLGFISGQWDSKGTTLYSRDKNLVSEWQDEPEKPEEINVSEMLVNIFHSTNGGLTNSCYYKERTEPLIQSTAIVATIKVSDWLKIQSGERNLIVGEGL